VSVTFPGLLHYDLMLLVMNLVILLTGGGKLVLL